MNFIGSMEMLKRLVQFINLPLPEIAVRMINFI
jgi:hypothetical protein